MLLRGLAVVAEGTGMAEIVGNGERVMLAHGGGGELTRELLAERIIPKLSNELLAPLNDSAVFDVPAGRLCMTTDAFVVQPLEFPGGDIGCVAVCGTVNDIAVMGATPGVLSLALVIEEGLEMRVLDGVVDSIAAAAKEAGVVIGTGDTKVIEAGGSGGMTITTAGVGVMREGLRLDVGRIVPGDVVIVSGRIAEHGLAVMAAREEFGFRTELVSDVAPLAGLIECVCPSGCDVRFMRDPTRGGLAGLLADLAEDTGCSIEIEESAVPISRSAVHMAELLGLDPLTVANEGKVVIVTSEADAARVLEAAHGHGLGGHAAVIGRVTEAKPPLVEMVTRAGGRRLVQRPYGEQLPRIC